MKIERLVNLVGGELLNSPFISEVTHFTDDLKEVSRGTCFFAKNEKDLKKAVKKGAYAIISEKYFPILDSEIAWIKVKDFKRAVFDIFKYENLKTKIFTTDKITSSIIKAMNLEKNVVIVEDDINELLKALNLKEKFIVASSQELQKTFLNTEEIKSVDIVLNFKSLFKSVYKYNTEINLPLVYKENFSKALNFFEKNNLRYTLEFEIERFKPIFINSKFEILEYGKSEKVLITNIKNDEFFIDELNYLFKYTKHGKTIIVDKNHQDYLKEKFNFAVLVDFEFEFKKEEEKGLFDD